MSTQFSDGWLRRCDPLRQRLSWGQGELKWSTGPESLTSFKSLVTLTRAETKCCAEWKTRLQFDCCEIWCFPEILDQNYRSERGQKLFETEGGESERASIIGCKQRQYLKYINQPSQIKVLKTRWWCSLKGRGISLKVLQSWWRDFTDVT